MEKINVAELLKDCPHGMELDCVLFNNPVRYDGLDNEYNYPITILTENDDHLYLTEEGYLYNLPNSKCVIFPKGKTTWEGFHRPFKDGDIVAFDNPHRDNLQVFIFKSKKENNTLSSCYLMLDGDELDLEEGMYYVTRLATEEEKQKLFKAIKDYGYKWNEESKTLEKLIEPKFKIGDRVKNKDNYTVSIVRINDEYYNYVSEGGACGIFYIKSQDDWELVPNKFDINTLVPFESRVLVRNDESQYWIPAFWGYKRDDGYTTTFGWSKYCVPFDGNENLLGTINDCDEYYKTWE